MKKRITFLLLLIVTISLFSNIAFAERDDGAECWNCGHYHWGDYMCDECGACSENCTNSDCYEETHCPGCGQCYLSVQLWCEECGYCDDCAEESHCPQCGGCYMDLQLWCEDCGLCEECAAEELIHCLYCNQCSSTGYDVCDECGACVDCWVQQETHCLYCGACYMGSEDEELCQSCWGCSSCLGEICEYCHECEDCAVFAHEHHCEECGNCYDDVPQCENGSPHCQECCIFCEQCEQCLFDEGGELCDNCGLCLDCCKENAEAMGCSCGEYCVESSEWEEHVCFDCGTPFCEVEQCEYCGLCLDCCASNSDCSDSEPMCVENPEYEEHFCEDCGQCFHDVDMCEDCADEGIRRCIECCDEVKEESGVHKAAPKSSWAYNETHHYHECKYCDEYEHYTGAELHKFGQDGICTVCKYNNGSKGIITQHPKNATATVTDVVFGDDKSPLSPYNNKVTYSITAKDAKSYQWYVKYAESKWLEVKDDDVTKGAKTNTLTVSVPSDACNCQYSYKCVVIGNDGKTYESSPAMLICKHAFDYGHGESVTTKSLGEFYYKNGAHMTIYESSGHKIPCLGEGCDKYVSKEIIPHVYKNAPKEVTDKDGVKWNEYECSTCRYHYFVKQSEDTLKNTKADVKKITSVEVKDVDLPKVGSKPDYTGTVGDASYALKKYSNETIENGINWYDISEQKDLKVKQDSFKADHDYKLKIYLTVTPGYEFAEKVTGKISGKVAQVLVQDNQVILSVEFKSSDDGSYAADEKTLEQKKEQIAEEKKEKTKEEAKEAINESIKNNQGASWSKASDWALEELKKAKDLGVVPGIFKKKDLTENVSRKEFAHIAVKLFEKLSGNKAVAVANNPFKDTDDVEILKAYNVGITLGTGADTFSPNDLITREQMATMMARALTKVGIDTTVDLSKAKKFADDGEMHDWGRPSIYYMSNIEIIKGMGDNKFGVLGNATREQALLISERSAEKLKK